LSAPLGLALVKEAAAARTGVVVVMEVAITGVAHEEVDWTSEFVVTAVMARGQLFFGTMSE
jgi:hypothetical protein